MKFKFSPIYVYLGIIVLAAVVIIFFTDVNNGTSPNSTAQMPDDDVHRNLPKDGTPPSAANVQKEIKERIDAMKKDVESNPADTLKMRQLADLLFQAHQPEEAGKYYEMIIKKDPKRIDMMFALSSVYYFKQDFDKTEEITKQILKVNPNNLEAKFNLGAVAATKGDTLRARAYWKEVLSGKPGHELEEMAKDALERTK